MACTGNAFRSKSRHTPDDQLKRMQPIMQSLMPLITFVADCVQPKWRSILSFHPSLRIEPALGKELHGSVVLRDGSFVALAPYCNIKESTVDRSVWVQGDPRIVGLHEEYLCDVCGKIQEEEDCGDERNRCRCTGGIFNDVSMLPKIFIFETEEVGYGIASLTVCTFGPQSPRM